jgi:hypothetical protein
MADLSSNAGQRVYELAAAGKNPEPLAASIPTWRAKRFKCGCPMTCWLVVGPLGGSEASSERSKLAREDFSCRFGSPTVEIDGEVLNNVGVGAIRDSSARPPCSIFLSENEHPNLWADVILPSRFTREQVEWLVEELWRKAWYPRLYFFEAYPSYRIIHAYTTGTPGSLTFSSYETYCCYCAWEGDTPMTREAYKQEVEKFDSPSPLPPSTGQK